MAFGTLVTNYFWLLYTEVAIIIQLYFGNKKRSDVQQLGTTGNVVPT
jgi:hypothetical protein